MNTNKHFLRECALYIKGDVSEIRIKGNPKTVSLFAKALSESRRFYIALHTGKLRAAIPLLERKRAASRALRENIGYIWPL